MMWTVFRAGFWQQLWQDLRHDPLQQLGKQLPWLLLLFCLLLQFYSPQVIQTLRHAGFDQLQRWLPRPAATMASPVRLLDIDDASLQKLGQWPWPRARLAELLGILQQAGARVVVFDMLFAEPGQDGPSGDQQFSRRMQTLPVVLGLAGNNRATIPPATLPVTPFVLRGRMDAASIWPALPRFRQLLLPLPELTQRAAGLGSMAFLPDSDGIVRRVPLLLTAATAGMSAGKTGVHPVPALSLEAVRLYRSPSVSGRQAPYLLDSGGNGLQQLRIGNLAPLPLTAEGEAWLHYAPANQVRTLPLWQVLTGTFAPDAVRGRIVLIGTSAQGLQDLRFSPLGEVIPGVEIHAQAIEQMLSGTLLQRPFWASALEMLCLLIGGGLLIHASHHQRARPAFFRMLLLVSSLLAMTLWAFQRHYLFDALVPLAGLLLVASFCGLQQHIRNERQARWIRGAFARYVSPNRVEYLIRHPEALALGGQRQVCSFVFTDLAGFTTLMEKLDPAEAVGLLNTYLDAMIGIAFHHEGTLDRITGDAIAIMFSAPIRQEDHAWRALACAAEMQQFAREYATRLQIRQIPFGQTRIGIHTGEVLVGNFGGSSIVDYRALGDTVNTAARLESANKHFSTLMCVSEATLTAAEAGARQDLPPRALPVVTRPIGRLVLRGRHQALMTYELCLAPMLQVSDHERLRAYAEAFPLLEKAPEAALRAFRDLKYRYPEDGVIHFHWQRLQAGIYSDRIVLDAPHPVGFLAQSRWPE